MGLLCLSVVTSDAKITDVTFPSQPFSWKYGRKTPPGLEMAVIKVSFR